MAQTKIPPDLAGMALPDFNAYYLAAKLSQIFHIDKVDRERFLCNLCPRWSQTTQDSLVAIKGGARSEGRTINRRSVLYHYTRIWKLASDRLHLSAMHDFTPHVAQHKSL